MLKQLEDWNWSEAFNAARDIMRVSPPGSCNGPASFDQEDVAAIYHVAEGQNDGDAWRCAGMFADGMFFYLEAWCDYTGWDCRAGGSITFSPTYEDMMRFGLDNRARAVFGIPAI